MGEGDGRIPALALREAMLAAGDRLSTDRDALSALDAAAGDGDLGVTLATGFAHVRVALEQLASPDVGELFSETGRQLASKAPSTVGTLLGTGFLRAGAALRGVATMDSRHVALMLEEVRDAVMERGGAVPGQRTIVDALDGSAQSAAAAVSEGLDPVATLSRAAAGASAASAETSAMEPHFGRAVWVGERARGNEDAGAAAWATYLTGLAEATVAALGEAAPQAG